MPNEKPRKTGRRLNLSLEPPSDRERIVNENVFGRLLGQAPADPAKPEANPLPKLNPVQNLNPVQAAPGSNFAPGSILGGGAISEPARGFLKVPNKILDDI